MAERSFTGLDGTSWQAWDVVPGQHADWPAHARQHLPEAMSEGWLCFECAGEKRRLHPIPPGWASGSDDDLRAFCRDASPVVRRLPDQPREAAAGVGEHAASV